MILHPSSFATIRLFSGGPVRRVVERVIAGIIYRPGEGQREGWILHDGARVIDEGEGVPPSTPTARGFIMPSPVNAHTHAGDFVARGRFPRGASLAEVVAPPDGFKHRVLRETPPEALRDGMRAAVAEMRDAKTFIDFREGGEAGARMLRDVAPRAKIFGRCTNSFDEAEAERVLAVADGYGLSALGDVKGDEPERVAALARRLGKSFALHLSEDKREDAQRAISLSPAFVVHCVLATKADLRALASARVPIVACPRSNALFGPLPPVGEMLDEGVTLALGTDNAMMHPMNVLDEARFLFARGLPREALLDALIVGGRVAAFGVAPKSFLRKGDDADFVVLPEFLGAGLTENDRPAGN